VDRALFYANRRYDHLPTQEADIFATMLVHCCKLKTDAEEFLGHLDRFGMGDLFEILEAEMVSFAQARARRPKDPFCVYSEVFHRQPAPPSEVIDVDALDTATLVRIGVVISCASILMYFL
jgi:hypothetical protein